MYWSSIIFSSCLTAFQSKLAILQSFSVFLRAGLSIHYPKENLRNLEGPLYAWFMSNSFSTPRAFKEFENLFTPSIYTHMQPHCSGKRTFDWTKLEELPQNYRFLDIDVSWTIRDVEDVITIPERLSEGSDVESPISTFLAVRNERMSLLSKFICVYQHLARTLHPLLVSTILDCAPSIFSPDGKSSEIEMSMMVTVCQIVSLLYGTLLGSAEVVSDTSAHRLSISSQVTRFPHRPCWSWKRS